MHKKITRLALCVLLFAHSFQAQAQESTKVPRIGYLTDLLSPPTNATPDLNADAFQQGLRDLGYIEGKNILVEYRYLEGKEDQKFCLFSRTPATQGRCSCRYIDVINPRRQAS